MTVGAGTPRPRRLPSLATLRAQELVRNDPELAARVLLLAEPTVPAYVKGPDDIAMLCAPAIRGLPYEALWCCALGRRGNVIDARVLSTGTDGYTIVDPRQILRFALTCGALPAHSIAIAHNHPSGDPTPSHEDIASTARVRAACDIIGIVLLDHVVMGARSYVSLAQRGAV